MSAEHLKIAVRVTEVQPVNALITRFSLEALDGSDLPVFLVVHTLWSSLELAGTLIP